MTAHARTLAQDNGAVKIAQIKGMEWRSESHLMLDLAPAGLERVARQIEARVSRSQFLEAFQNHKRISEARKLQ